ncbi:MAG TPA: hypothetical protein VGB84_04620 [Arachidicoccus sp.]
MAELRKRLLKFSTGKQIILYGNSIGIGKSLEVGECIIPNILALPLDADTEQTIQNPQHLTADEVMELADFMTGLWLQLKENIRTHGLSNPKIFVRENIR